MLGHGVGWREFKEGNNRYSDKEGSGFEANVFPWALTSSSGSSCVVWCVAACGK